MKLRTAVVGVLAALGLAAAAPAVAQTHNGYVDSMHAQPGGIWTTGWVCRIWYPQYTYLDHLEIYEDGVAGVGTLVYSGLVLNINRPDTASYCGGSQTMNGFQFTFFWSNPAPNRQYYVYVWDNQTGQLQLLNPAPFTPVY